MSPSIENYTDQAFVPPASKPGLSEVDWQWVWLLAMISLIGGAIFYRVKHPALGGQKDSRQPIKRQLWACLISMGATLAIAAYIRKLPRGDGFDGFGRFFIVLTALFSAGIATRTAIGVVIGVCMASLGYQLLQGPNKKTYVDTRAFVPSNF